MTVSHPQWQRDKQTVPCTGWILADVGLGAQFPQSSVPTMTHDGKNNILKALDQIIMVGRGQKFDGKKVIQV